jgi:hypothetical protein
MKEPHAHNQSINKPRIKGHDPKTNCVDPLAFRALDPGRSTRDRGTRHRPRTLQLWSRRRQEGRRTREED